MCISGIDTSLRDSKGRTALDILKEHPAPKAQQITALIQGETIPHLNLDYKETGSLLWQKKTHMQ